MRPLFVFCAVVLLAVASFGQDIPRHYVGGFYDGFGPYVPLVTTPMVSLQQVSPNPVGASNATTGLIAGATNSTLSQVQGSTSSVYTVAVWYQGGAPLVSPEVNLFPEPIGREKRFHTAMMEEHAMREHGATESHAWIYYSGAEHTDSVAAASGAKGSGKAGHHYTNDDVTRQNDNNGTVKHGGKTEKM